MSVMNQPTITEIVLGNTETEEDYERGITTNTRFEIDDGLFKIMIVQTKRGGRTYTTEAAIPVGTFAVEVAGRLLGLE